ncbi:MAG TPA: hypothetical protein PK052_01805 [Anaerohalosphaeraceae bacterium]|nr:hypothetical protein [Anaerohalosphaeraceae bacterium]HOL30690.1 hypothetical protein [Anaerohalosphaeraceae bacterium]HOM75122.1 hypothetical protein [Anaerohalosphaeraceae bacterium]HPC63431.1 hypothetical protein [Anaerohalosphaeraceae bacterium]HPO70351.1 hypothetical protein [Anaerohalosphaeraceae bacterium]
MRNAAFISIFTLSMWMSVYCLSDTYIWTSSAGGQLGDPSNWLPFGIPGQQDDVRFTLAGSYGVWLDQPYTHQTLMVDGSELALDLRGHNWRFEGWDDRYRCVTIGDANASKLAVSGGGTVSSHAVFLGWGNDLETVLELAGENTEWIANIDGNWDGLFAGGVGGLARLRVYDNAVLKHGHGESGRFRGNQTVIEIEDPNSEWYVDGWFGMSWEGATDVFLKNGARAKFGMLEMAVLPGSSAVISLTGRETELAIENWWDYVPLFIGRQGWGVVNMTDSRLFCSGNMVLAEQPGSAGQLNLYGSSWADCQGSAAVGGDLDSRGGTAMIHLQGDLWNGFYSTLTAAYSYEGQSIVVWPKGTIRMDGGTITLEYGDRANPVVLKGGILEGWGWIWGDVQNESGRVALGAIGDWKALDIGYNYTQNAAGVLKISIGGRDTYWQYGGLVLTNGWGEYGRAYLDGMLEVELLYGFIPDPSDEFVIIDAQQVEGQFVNAAGAGGIGKYVFEQGTFDVWYESNRVVLRNFRTEPSCPAFPDADLNRDCRVDLADLSRMAAQWLDCGLQPLDYCY